MKALLKAHPAFDFTATITTLQRGLQDPVNLIDNGAWLRYFQIKQKPALITTAYDDGIQITLHTGKAKKQDIENLIHHCLGLDDPLLMQGTTDKRLLPAWGIAVPGFPSIFEALIQILFGQLVSVPVANNMRRRFALSFGTPLEHAGKTYYAYPEPQDLVLFNESDFKDLGTSQMKVRSIMAIARAFAEDGLEAKLLALQDREERYRLLKSLYGVGHWTVDWLMLRALRQFDIVPATDLVVRKAVTWYANKKTLLSEKETLRYMQRFQPYAGAFVYRILCAYVKDQHQQKLLV